MTRGPLVAIAPPWGIYFQRFGPERRLAVGWFAIGTMLSALSVWWALSNRSVPAFLVLALSLAASAAGIWLGELFGRRVLVNSQRFGFYPAWSRRIGPHGWLLAVVLAVAIPVLLVLVPLTLIRASFDDLQAVTSLIPTLYLFAGALILGNAAGLRALERRSDVTVWVRNGYETRASRAVGVLPFPVYYVRPKGYRVGGPGRWPSGELDRVGAAGIFLALVLYIVLVASSIWFWPYGALLGLLILAIGLAYLEKVRRAQRAHRPSPPA